MLSRDLWVRYQAFENLKPASEKTLSEWLSDAERLESERYRDPGRLREWLAGRWLAKQLLNEQFVPWSMDWRDIEVLSRNDKGQAVRPMVRLMKIPQPWCVSISHSHRGALVAVSLEKGIDVGVDLAEKEELNSQSLVFWFSAKEREHLRQTDARQAAVSWAVKEAVYKAINTGESFVPKKFEVFPSRFGGYDCHYEGESLSPRLRVAVWDVDQHVAVTAVLASSPEKLHNLPQNGGRMNQLVYLERNNSVLDMIEQNASVVR